MSITLGVSAKGVVGAGTSVANAGVTTTAGSLLVIVAQWEETGTFVSIVDNKSNTSWQEIATELHYGACRTRAWYHTNIAGGVSHQVTVTITAGLPITLFFVEVKGAALASPLDGTPGRVEDVATPWTSPSVTLSEAGSMLVGAMLEFGAGGTYTHTVGNAFTKLSEEVDGSSFFPGCSMYQLPGATGAYNTSLTTSNDGNVSSAVCWLMAFKAASGPALPDLEVRLEEPWLGMSTF